MLDTRSQLIDFHFHIDFIFLLWCKTLTVTSTLTVIPTLLLGLSLFTMASNNSASRHRCWRRAFPTAMTWSICSISLTLLASSPSETNSSPLSSLPPGSTSLPLGELALATFLTIDGNINQWSHGLWCETCLYKYSHSISMLLISV